MAAVAAGVAGRSLALTATSARSQSLAATRHQAQGGEVTSSSSSSSSSSFSLLHPFRPAAELSKILDKKKPSLKAASCLASSSSSSAYTGELGALLDRAAILQVYGRDERCPRSLASSSKTPAMAASAVMAPIEGNVEPKTTTADGTSGLRGKLNRVVLAYSGGLDTSVIVPWLRENYDCEVVCFTADVGQGTGETSGLEEKAKASGASQLVIRDLKEEFVKDFIFPCLKAGAIYERKYLLGTSMARPVIAKAMVDVAHEVGADAVAHGCTGKGNDQVRFELTFCALDPSLKIVAPWREWDIKGREDAIDFAKKHNIPIPVTKKSIYSRDRNLWHLSHEGDLLEDPANEPKEDMYLMSTSPENAPDAPEYVDISFEAGIPVKVNGQDLSPASLVSVLNDLGGKHGIGRCDMVENRFVGMKSRGVYETPGGTILVAAAKELEALCLDRETIAVKDTLALKYAEIVYAGQWFCPLREGMDKFMDKVTETCTGTVRMKLYKGCATVASRTSPFSLYREDISSFEEGSGIYNQADAEGFIRLYGLPTRVRAMLREEQQ